MLNFIVILLRYDFTVIWSVCYRYGPCVMSVCVCVFDSSLAHMRKYLIPSQIKLSMKCGSSMYDGVLNLDIFFFSVLTLTRHTHTHTPVRACKHTLSPRFFAVPFRFRFFFLALFISGLPLRRIRSSRSLVHSFFCVCVAQPTVRSRRWFTSYVYISIFKCTTS